MLFDKDRGAEIFVRAVGGAYLSLQKRRPDWLRTAQSARADAGQSRLSWAASCASLSASMAGRSPSPTRAGSTPASRRCATSPARSDRLSALRVFLGQRDPEGIGARLERWCKGGSLGWVLDADEDAISLDALALGFDMTDVLDHPAVRTPLMMYLFHRVEELIDGRRIVIAIDEFWKALGDEAFRALANDGLKTIRKKNGVMVFGTQSPRDALASPIAHTIVEQCPTQVFFPNPRGQLADYVDGFHLTRTRIPPHP